MNMSDLKIISLGIAFGVIGIKSIRKMSVPIQAFASKAHYFRILFFGGFLALFAIVLFILCLYGIYYFLPYVESSVFLEKSPGRGLPIGDYSGWAIIIFFMGACTLFGSLAWTVIYNGFQGLKKRNMD
jgi:hypothetical protein